MSELTRILDLKAQAQIELKQAQEKIKALEFVEKMLRDAEHTSNVVEIQPSIYKKLKQEVAVRDVLTRAGKALTASEIADALRCGGFQFTSKDLANSLYATMKKNAKGLYFCEKKGNRTVFGLARKLEVNIAN